MKLPILPFDDPPVNLERDPLWLSDVQRLQIFPIAPFGFNGGWVIVVRWCLIKWPPHGWNVNVDDGLGIGIEDWGKVQRVGVLIVIGMRSVVHQGLL